MNAVCYSNVITQCGVCLATVTAVETPREAMQALRGEERLDLMLLDAEGPKGKGLRMLRHLVKLEALQHIPIISEYCITSQSLSLCLWVYLWHDVCLHLLPLVLFAYGLGSAAPWCSDVVAGRDGGGGQVPAFGSCRLPGEAPAHQRAAQPLDAHVAPQEGGEPAWQLAPDTWQFLCYGCPVTDPVAKPLEFCKVEQLTS